MPAPIRTVIESRLYEPVAGTAAVNSPDTVHPVPEDDPETEDHDESTDPAPPPTPNPIVVGATELPIDGVAGAAFAPGVKFRIAGAVPDQWSTLHTVTDASTTVAVGASGTITFSPPLSVAAVNDAAVTQYELEPGPITVEQAKLFAQETNDAYDSVMQDIIDGALMAAEHHLNRAIRRQLRRWDYTYDPGRDPLWLEPLTVARVWRAENGAFDELDTDEFDTIAANGQLFPAGQEDGSARLRWKNIDGDWVGRFAYRAEAVCGWTNEDLPDDLRLALLVFIKELYDSRGVRDIGRPKTKPWATVEHYSWRLG